MFDLNYTNKFEKDLKRIKKRSNTDFELVRQFLNEDLVFKGAKGNHISQNWFSF
jgi:mRNA-degrading endonuclease YafQ of YafQ-DinJ toxin-antitoxin module